MMRIKTTKDAIMTELKRDLAEWMEADEDLVWRPAVQIMKEGNEFAARVLIPGIDPKDLHVLVARDMMLIKGMSEGRRIMKSAMFAEPIDVDRVHVSMKDGMLSVRAPIACAMMMAA